jgi:hypothetical protein
MKKTKLDRVLENTSGKFFTLGFRTTKDSGSICAKFRRKTPNCVFVEDVNTGEERRFDRKSVVSARCGSLVYNG